MRELKPQKNSYLQRPDPPIYPSPKQFGVRRRIPRESGNWRNISYWFHIMFARAVS